MKKCTHCGKEYPDDVLVCADDAWPLADQSPLKITVVTDSATHQYAQQTSDATLSALRADILQGAIPKEAKATFETKTGNAKPQIFEGTLIKCALRYPILADIYAPIRRHARAGMGYGILAGVSFHILMLGFAVFQTNQQFGAIIMALPVCAAIGILFGAFKINVPIIQTPCMLAAVIISGYLGFNGLFPMLLGAVVGGGILFCMPGMTIGAIVGTIRRPRLPRAHDAQPENAALRIIIPLVISIALWTAYLIWARSYLQGMLK